MTLKLESFAQIFVVITDDCLEGADVFWERRQPGYKGKLEGLFMVNKCRAVILGITAWGIVPIVGLNSFCGRSENIKATAKLEELCACEYIIKAGPENLSKKAPILVKLDEYCVPYTGLVSDTS